MRILAIDTSVGSGSVAASDERGLSERPLGPAGSHARVLTAALADMAAARGWGDHTTAIPSLGSHDLIAVVSGPGSFTGLRVGVTAAKALAWTTGARLVAVSGFEVLARQAATALRCHAGPFVVAYDAGRGEVYTATVTRPPSGWSVGPAALMAVDAWIDAVPTGSRLTGPGLDAIVDRLASRGDLWIATPELRYPSAGETAATARERAEAGLFDDPLTLVPNYLRPSYAEERKPAVDG